MDMEPLALEVVRTHAGAPRHRGHTLNERQAARSRYDHMLDRGDKLEIADETHFIIGEFLYLFSRERCRHRRHVVEPKFGKAIEVLLAARVPDPALLSIDNVILVVT